MKKAIRGEEVESDNGTQDVEAYLANVPEPARSTLARLRETIRSAVPAEATEGISYSMPAFKYKGVLVGYAAFKNHCSFFPMSAALMDALGEALLEFRTSKGTLQFPVDKALPAALVKRMVMARVAENEGKKVR